MHIIQFNQLTGKWRNHYKPHHIYHLEKKITGVSCNKTQRKFEQQSAVTYKKKWTTFSIINSKRKRALSPGYLPKRNWLKYNRNWLKIELRSSPSLERSYYINTDSVREREIAFCHAFFDRVVPIWSPSCFANFMAVFSNWLLLCFLRTGACRLCSFLNWLSVMSLESM